MSLAKYEQDAPAFVASNRVSTNRVPTNAASNSIARLPTNRAPAKANAPEARPRPVKIPPGAAPDATPCAVTEAT